jgi:outer membrane protein OmpA-like peptidoglycan-associated protein
MKHIIRSTTGALVAGMIAAGCSTSPPASEVTAANTVIGNAGMAVDQAAADPHVAKYASSELDRASGSLQKAKSAWNDKHDLPAATHFAYLAQQRAATAHELANARAAEDTLAVAAANRDSAVSAMMAERRAPPPPAATPTATTEQMQQSIVGFASGAAKLPSDAQPMIDGFASTLNKDPASKVVIEGYTDSVGSPDHNQTLAMQRAESVRAALVRQGIDPSRITIRSHGEDNPMASNDTSAGRRENRRAQVIIGNTDTQMGSSQGSTAATSSGQGEKSGQSRQSGKK